MQLNIKNDKTYELAANLSQLTGENLTQAVTKAIVERLERVTKQVQSNRKGLSEKLLEHAKSMRNKHPLMDDRNHTDILYDESGLPKSRDNQ